MSQSTPGRPDSASVPTPTAMNISTLPPASSSSSSSSSSTSPTSSDDPLGFVWDLKANPCFRSSLMWGIGLGAAMGVHAFTRNKLPYKASDTAVKTFFVTSSLSWLWCRHQAKREKELFDAVINLELSARQQKKAADGSDGATRAQPSALTPTANST